MYHKRGCPTQRHIHGIALCLHSDITANPYIEHCPLQICLHGAIRCCAAANTVWQMADGMRTPKQLITDQECTSSLCTWHAVEYIYIRILENGLCRRRGISRRKVGRHISDGALLIHDPGYSITDTVPKVQTFPARSCLLCESRQRT
jgi:hypothetical protein